MKDDLRYDKYKSIHFNVLNDTHAGLRIIAFKYKLTMQEILEELAQRIVQEDPVFLKILDELYENKKYKKVKKLSQTDAQSVYEVIDRASPFSD